MAVVKDADAAALTVAGAEPTDFADATRAGDDDAKLRIPGESGLEQTVRVVGKEAPNDNREGVSLDEDHRRSIRQWHRHV